MSASFIVLVLMTTMAAVYVVFSRNIVHAAISLGLSFLGVAGLYLLLNAPFLAGAQVLIYVGAITVLIMFALMMTAQRILREPRNAAPYRAASALVSFVLFAILVWSSWYGPWREAPAPDPVSDRFYLDQLAAGLLGTYLLPFEVASVLLLVALVGAIVLAKEEREA